MPRGQVRIGVFFLAGNQVSAHGCELSFEVHLHSDRQVALGHVDANIAGQPVELADLPEADVANAHHHQHQHPESESKQGTNIQVLHRTDIPEVGRSFLGPRPSVLEKRTEEVSMGLPLASSAGKRVPLGTAMVLGAGKRQGAA